MKKNGLMTGVIIGGILGITVSVLGMRKFKGKAGKNTEGESQAENIQLKPMSEEKQESSDMKEDTVAENNGSDSGNKCECSEETGNRSTSENKPGSEETAQKTTNLAEESRDTAREEQMKAKQEGNFMMEDIAAKISFSQKISQLEEALKKLREENMQ